MAFIIVTNHMNLCIGTSSYIKPKKPKVEDVLTRLM